MSKRIQDLDVFVASYVGSLCCSMDDDGRCDLDAENFFKKNVGNNRVSDSWLSAGDVGKICFIT